MKKIKVIREGREGIYLVEKKEIIKWLKTKKFTKIHNMIGKNSLLLGADHDIKSVIEDIKNADKIGILTGKAQQNNFRHALAVILKNKLEMFDIGEIEDKDLIIK